MRTLTAPESVLIVGLSHKRRGHGYGVLRNLVRGGFRGTVHGVHPSGIDVDGTPVVPQVGDLPSPPDVALICTPNDTVVPLLDELGAIGCHAAVVFGSGFGEVEAGEDLAEAIRERAAKHGIDVVGPNCLGLIGVASNAWMTAVSLPEDLTPGPVAIVSQSGSGCILLTGCGRLRFSHVISSGNETVTGLADYLEYLVADEATGAIGLVLEGIGDPPRVLAAAEAARDRGIPIVALKLGRTERGAQRVQSHTGAVAGDAEVYEAFSRRAGIVNVRDYDELIESLAVLSGVDRKTVTGSQVAFVGLSGGEGALISDLADDIGLSLAELSDATRSALADALPSFATVGNPLDATGPVVGDAERFRDVVGTVAADAGVHCVVVFLDAPPCLGDDLAATYANLVAPLPTVADASGKPVIVLSNHGGAVHPRVEAALAGTTVPILRGTRPGLTAVAALVEAAEHRGDGRPTPRASAGGEALEQRAGKGRAITPPHAAETPGQPASDGRAILRRWSREGDGVAPPEVVEALAGACGLSLPQRALVDNVDDAAAAAAGIGYPVAIKTASPAVVHKSDVGGVATGIRDEPELREACERIVEAVGAPEVVVEQMIVGGVEAFIGCRTDPVFGPVMAVGSGGILVELYRDVSLALLPLTEDESRRAIDDTRLTTLLDGVRGRPPADREAFVDVMRRVSDLMCDLDDGDIEIDLNPVIVLPAGRGAKVVDMRVVKTER